MSMLDYEITVETDKTPNQSDISLEELSSLYQSVKKDGNDSIEKLTGDTVLKGMEEIDEMISDRVHKIKQYINNGKSEGFFSRNTSKALAVIDPNNKWLGRWASDSKDKLDIEATKQKTVNQIVDDLVAAIEVKRQDVLKKLEDAHNLGTKMQQDVQIYQNIYEKASKLLETLPPNTKKHLDAKFLVMMASQSRDNIITSIESELKPIIASASISAEKIGTLIPTIESNLKYKGGLKSFQQSVTDLNEMTKMTIALTEEAGDIIRKDIRKETLSTISMLGETGLDVDKINKIQIEELEHQKKLDEAVKAVNEKINTTFNKTQELSKNLLAHTQNRDSRFIDSYLPESET